MAMVAPETPRNGFALTDPQQVVSLHEARDVTAANAPGADMRQLMLAEGGEVWLPSVQKLQLADGWVDFDPGGAAVRAAALQASVGGAGDAAALGAAARPCAGGARLGGAGGGDAAGGRHGGAG